MAAEIIKPAFDYSAPRICNKCGVLFSGRGCKDCHNAARRVRRKNNSDADKAYARIYREQHKDRLLLAQVEYRKQNQDKVKDGARASRAKHKDSISAFGKAYRAANKDELRRKSSEYRQKTKPAIRARAKRYRRENLEKVRAQYSTWAKENPESNRVRVQNRRARRIANGGILSKGLVKRLFVLQRGKCPCCGKSLGGDYHLDHIVPLARGGSNSDTNMQLLKGVCNMQKHAKDPIDFMQERGFLI